MSFQYAQADTSQISPDPVIPALMSVKLWLSPPHGERACKVSSWEPRASGQVIPAVAWQRHGDLREPRSPGMLAHHPR